MARDLARNFLWHGQRPLLCSFLDRLGIAHDHGGLGGAPTPAPEAGALEGAVRGLLQPPAGFPRAVVRLYLTYLYFSEQTVWSGLAPLLSGWEEPERPSAVVAPPAHEPAPAEPEAPPGAPPAFAGEHLTTLDEVLIKTLVAGVEEIEGAPPSEKLADLVSEVVHLSPDRHRSYFHLGYLHALSRQPLQPDFAAGNPDRRLWYFTGAVVGLARYQDWPAIGSLVESGDLRELGRGPDERARQAAPHVVEALIQLEKAAAIGDFLAPAVVIPVGCFGRLFLHARGLFEEARLAEAEAILGLLHGALAASGVGEEDWVSQDVERLRAHCLQWRGDFGGAQVLLRGLLGFDNLRDRAAALTDAAMAQQGLRRLADVEIREPFEHLRERLTNMRAELEEALQAAGRSGHAHYCLGVLELMDGRHEIAAGHLDIALATLQSGDKLYRLFELPERCQFYLAVALLGSLEPAACSRALGLLDASFTAGFRPPYCLLRQAAEFLNMLGDQGGMELLATLVDSRLDEQALDALIEADSPTCAPLLHRLLQRGEDPARRSEARMQDLLLVARQARRVVGGSEMQARALDALEALARRVPMAAGDFLALLEDEAGLAFDPAWGPEDALSAAAVLREIRGERERAAELVVGLAFRVLHGDRFGAASEVADLADWAESLGADAGQLRARLVTAIPAAPASVGADGPLVRVAVIGSDEKLTAIAASLAQQVKQQDSKVETEVITTDWSCNWGRQFDRLEPGLGRYDAIVVPRLIRTDLGGMLRRAHPCWVGCSGRGAASYVPAILLAAQRAREMKRPKAAAAAGDGPAAEAGPGSKKSRKTGR
ncbi:MAG TPA: hypothetical protein VNF74_09385 [Terriglobales bacterium]|nr:hypothetical protein [Terriglobales bacterium]